MQTSRAVISSSKNGEKAAVALKAAVVCYEFIMLQPTSWERVRTTETWSRRFTSPCRNRNPLIKVIKWRWLQSCVFPFQCKQLWRFTPRPSFSSSSLSVWCLCVQPELRSFKWTFLTFYKVRLQDLNIHYCRGLQPPSSETQVIHMSWQTKPAEWASSCETSYRWTSVLFCPHA